MVPLCGGKVIPRTGAAVGSCRASSSSSSWPSRWEAPRPRVLLEATPAPYTTRRASQTNEAPPCWKLRVFLFRQPREAPSCCSWKRAFLFLHTWNAWAPVVFREPPFPLPLQWDFLQRAGPPWAESSCSWCTGSWPRSGRCSGSTRSTF